MNQNSLINAFLIDSYFSYFAGTVCIKVGPNDERDRVRVMQHQENAADENDCVIKVFYLDIGHEDKVPLSA